MSIRRWERWLCSCNGSERLIIGTGWNFNVKFVMEYSISGFPVSKVQKEVTSTEESGPDSPSKGHVKDVAKNIMKHAEKSARGIKHALSCKSRKSKSDSPRIDEREIAESDSSDDESLSASIQSPRDERIPVTSQPTVSSGNDSFDSRENAVPKASSATMVANECSMNKESIEHPKKVSRSDSSSKELVEAVERA